MVKLTFDIHANIQHFVSQKDFFLKTDAQDMPDQQLSLFCVPLDHEKNDLDINIFFQYDVLIGFYNNSSKKRQIVIDMVGQPSKQEIFVNPKEVSFVFDGNFVIPQLLHQPVILFDNDINHFHGLFAICGILNETDKTFLFNNKIYFTYRDGYVIFSKGFNEWTYKQPKDEDMYYFESLNLEPFVPT